jgi:molybdopterin-guanine dinucleotide biosynthesis protein
MSVIVIGGNSRNVGKTSVVAGLIAALPEFQWTAVKISRHEHGVRSAWSISEESDRRGESDASRFLAAGAARAFLVRTQPGKLSEAMPAIRQEIAAAANVIIESNSVLEFIRPDVYLTVLDPLTEDFKPSAQEFLDRANAVILHETANSPAWQHVSLKPVPGRPVFRIRPPQYVTPEIVAFVKSKLLAPSY